LIRVTTGNFVQFANQFDFKLIFFFAFDLQIAFLLLNQILFDNLLGNLY